MGDYYDFHNTRGENKKTYINVFYHSGTKERLEFKSKQSADKAELMLKQMSTVKRIWRSK